MQFEQLARHFDAMGARVRFGRRVTGSRRRVPQSFTIDVGRDRRGEYFDFVLGEQPPELELLQARPQERHLLLLASDGGRFLCGHDERHWFVAAIGERVSTVRGAKRALLPEAIREQVKGLPPGEVDNRRNAAFVRQGEWFFVPSGRELPNALILKDEPLQRSAGSKPHVCQELCRYGGELVYLVGRQVLTEAEFKKARERDSGFARAGYRTMIRNPTVYARGYVRHADHATVVLDGWHRVLLNAEFTTSQVSFLD